MKLAFEAMDKKFLNIINSLEIMIIIFVFRPINMPVYEGVLELVVKNEN